MQNTANKGTKKMKDNYEHTDKKHIAEIMKDPDYIQLATRALDESDLRINIHAEELERLKKGKEELNTELRSRKEEDSEVNRSEAREKNIKLINAKKYNQKLQGMNPFRKRLLNKPN